jgi:hypothetical protein
MDINEARRLKELERKNNGLKKMLAESLLQEPGALEAEYKKNCEPGPSPGGGAGTGEERDLFATGGLPDIEPIEIITLTLLLLGSKPLAAPGA